MKELSTAIDHLYHTFQKYTAQGIHYCNCGCTDEEDVRKLNSKPLKQLEEDDLIAYHLSALYTWGDVEHYKHYLPRICELLSKNKTGLIDIDVLYTKLVYAKWDDWSINEQQAIKEFFTSNWLNLVSKQSLKSNSITLFFHNQLIDIQTLIKLWKNMKNDISIKSFVCFYNLHTTQIENEPNTLELNQLLDSMNILEILENAFFDLAETNNYFADKISSVHQMIELELK